MLKKNFFRELLYIASQLVSVIVITIAAVLLFVALSGLYYNANRITSQYFEEQNVADYWISGVNFNRTDFNKIEALSAVSEVQARTLIDLEDKNDENITLTVYGIADDYNINIPYIAEGRFPLTNHEMMVSKEFAIEHNLNIGDTYEMLIKEYNKIISLQICALINSPECMHHINSNNLVPDYSKYGFAYVNDKVFSDFTGENLYNQFCVTVNLNDSYTNSDFKNDLIYILGKKLTYILSFKDNENAYMLLDQIGALKVAILVFPTIFFLVAALIMFSTMSRIIENSRSKIGTLKALGYSDRTILLYYLSYAAIVVVIGFLLGAFPANSMLTKPVSKVLFSFIDMPPYDIVFYKNALFIAFILTNIFCIATAFFVTKHSLGEKPAECMRPKPPKALKENIFEKVTFLWQGLNFTQKYIIRNIFRNKIRPIIFISGVAGCMTLILTSFGMRNSLDNRIDQLVNKLHKYDLMATFKYDITERQYKHIKEMDYVQDIQYEMVSSGKLSFANKSDITTVTVTEDILTIKLIDKSGPDIMYMPTNGLVMSDDTAEELSVKIGDIVSLELPHNNKKHMIEVAHICDDIKGVYLSRSFWRDLSEGFLPTNVYIKTDNIENLTRRFSDYDFIEFYKNKNETTEAIINQLATISIIVFLFIAFGGVLALAVLYNLGTMSFFEQIRNLATLMVLGFYNKEIKKLLLTENIIFTFIGVLLGIPLGIKLTHELMGSMGAFSMVVKIKILSYFMAGILTVGFALIINAILAKKMQQIDMLGALKSIE